MNKNRTARVNTDINRSLISSQMQSANVQSHWREPNWSGTIDVAKKGIEKYLLAEKDAAFKRLDLEASKMQIQEIEDIRVADSNEKIPEIENQFKTQVNEAFSQDNWGKQWLKERGDLFFAANSRDVMRSSIAKQHELYTLELNKTLGTWANDIATSAEDKARALMGDADNYISASQLLSPEEKQKTKDNFLKLTLQKMATNNPEMAKSFLASGEFDGNIGIDAKSEIDSIIKKQIAELDFQRKLDFFNNEREMSEKLDDMPADEALRFLEENEANVTKGYYEAKKNALMAVNGITAETRAETATALLLEVGIAKAATGEDGLLKNEAILTRIEKEYAKGNLDLKDKKTLIKTITNQQVEDLPEMIDDASVFRWFTPYDYSDANDDFVDALGSSGVANTAMLEYFRTINASEREYNAKDRKDLAKNIIEKYKGAALTEKPVVNNAYTKVGNFGVRRVK